MNATRRPVIDLRIVSDRPSFVAEVQTLATEADGVRARVLEGGDRPGSASAALAALAENAAAALLIDATSDGRGALEIVRTIFERHPSLRVVVAGPASDPALILESQRAGASEFLPVPFDRQTLLETLQRLRRRAAPEASLASMERGRILTFLGSKGGCGTTTVASNLAVTLARQGHPTVLVDLDLTAGDASVLLDLTPAFGVPDVVQNAHRLDRELLNGMVVKHSSGLEVLCAGEDPERAGEVGARHVGPILAFLRDQYKCVVVNARDAFDPVGAAAAQHADAVHLVTSVDLLALRRAQWSLRRLSQEGIAPEVLRLVVNRYEKNPHISLDEAEKVLGLKVTWTIPADARTVHHAVHEGLPAVSASRNGLHAAFEEYAGRLFARPKSAAPARRTLLSLFTAPARRPAAEGGAL